MSIGHKILKFLRRLIGKGPEGVSAEWIELKTDESNAVIVKYGQNESRKLLNRFMELDFHNTAKGDAGSMGTLVVDQLASTSAVIATGLQSGQVFQVIGTPHLVEGLKAGTYTLMQTSEGTLGTVVSSSGEIAGQLRFAEASLAPVVAPVIAWQLLHAIAGTTQLRKINRRLDTIQRKLEILQNRQEAGVLGEIRWANTALDDILSERLTTGTFTQDMQIRLAQVEKSLGTNLERYLHFADYYHGKTKFVKNERGKNGAVQGITFIQEEGTQAVRDLELLVLLAAADLRFEEARLYIVTEHNQRDVQRRLDTVTEKVARFKRLLSELPSIEGIADHTKSCVEEMGWWQRNVFARGVAKEAKAVTNGGIQDVRLPEIDKAGNDQNGYVFWRDKKGDVKVRMLPNSLNEEF